MVGLLSSPFTPQLSTGQFLGDALSGLGSGLLAYGAGGPLRQQAGLIGLQGLQQAQQLRRQNAMDALQMQYMQQRGADFAAQAAEREQEAQRQRVLQQRYNAVIGGQPMQGPVQPGQPPLPNSPINPALSSFPKSIQELLPGMDYQQGSGLIAQLATQKPQAPIVQNFEEGNDVVSKQYDPTSGKWVELSRGPKWDPNAGQANQNKLFGNPIYFKGPDGRLQVGLPGMDGQMHVIPMAQGTELTPGTSQVDTGTGTAIVNNKTGDTVSTINKDIQGKEVQTEKGKAQGQLQATLPSAQSQAEQTLQLVEDLKNDPAIDEATGLKGLVMNRIPTTAAYAYTQKVNQLKGQVFLQAYGQLKGAGAITEVEGTKAEQAIARLNTAQSKQDFLSALNDFEKIVKVGQQNLLKKAGVTPGTSSAPTDTTSAPRVLKYNPATGKLE